MLSGTDIVFGFEMNPSPRIETSKAYGQLAFEFMENLNFELTRCYANSNVSPNIRNMIMWPYNPNLSVLIAFSSSSPFL